MHRKMRKYARMLAIVINDYNYVLKWEFFPQCLCPSLILIFCQKNMHYFNIRKITKYENIDIISSTQFLICNAVSNIPYYKTRHQIWHKYILTSRFYVKPNQFVLAQHQFRQGFLSPQSFLRAKTILQFLCLFRCLPQYQATKCAHSKYWWLTWPETKRELNIWFWGHEK